MSEHVTVGEQLHGSLASSVAAVYASPRKGGEAFNDNLSTVISPLKAKRAERVHRTTIRRIRGFLADAPSGLETRVVFIIDGENHEYFLPSRYLKRNGITEKGQPFEMDEYEEVRNGKLSIGTEFRAMAPAKSAQKVILTLSAEEQGYRDAILGAKKS